MAKYEIYYFVVKDDVEEFQGTAEVSLTKKDIADIEEFVVNHNYSPEFVDVPSKVYDKCSNVAFEKALREYKKSANADEGYEVVLEEYIPTDIIGALSADTQRRVLENIPVVDREDHTPKQDTGVDIIDSAISTEATRNNVRLIIPVLIHWAKTRQNYRTYGDLIHAINKKVFSGIGHTLYEVQNVLNKLSEISGRKIPTLNSLVKNKDTHLPSEGFEYVIPNYKERDDSEKKILVNGLDNEAMMFEHWNWVLSELGLLPYKPLTKSELSEVANVHGGFGGGEGEEHKNLKEYVLNNPKSIGLSDVEDAQSEYLLPSADRLDVFFRLTDNTHVAVEVKPSTSDDSDINRGIFQCVKYRAVMKAWRLAEGADYDVKVVFVTARELSDVQTRLVSMLSIEHKLLKI
jgi:hypothetical protein